MTVAYSGAEGAFAHEACLRFVPEHEPIALPTFSDVVDAVESGSVDLGMLPIANNAAGETGARELVEKAGLVTVEEHSLPVRMHLLGMPSAKLEQIRTVVSHPVALLQCTQTLSEMGVRTEETSNTAVAAKMLTNPDRGVLASKAAADLYGLTILRRDVHDRPDNATRFAIVARGER
ncbi:prephenate dehydratase domain-containing protein [Sphingomonas daechungensis]|uniref:prephenate dehydratase domain-containing protein n=1 Tax=Sphingomonas daechungensis TaxID=1176646 RepID=UPI0031F0FB26